jgi:hypothetical protein
MSDWNELTGFLPQSPLGLALLVVAAIVLMYLGRPQAHAVIRALSQIGTNALRLAADQVVAAQERLMRRNREVLIEQGREATERMIEREFERVNTVVTRDLGGYPALHRKLSDQIVQIDEDYRKSTESPPQPPEWVRAVEIISGIPSNGDPVVGKILGDIHKALSSAQKEALTEYRKSSHERHRLLQKMLPFWRRLDRTLTRVDGTIRGLEERSQVIDRQMESYEQIRAGSDDAVRTLSASTMTVFFSALLVLLIALAGAFINFHLIALPMSEMVGGNSAVGPMKISDVAAMVIISMELAMGLFLMESLRITRLFPVIGAMDDVMRRRLVWISFIILTTLACVESSLAYMRDLLAADREALAQSLAGVEAVRTEFRWIPSIGQMVMGFVLPFALTFVAIPLESFIQSSRTVGGNLLALAMRGFAGLLRVIGGFVDNAGTLLVHLYDFLIILPLRVELFVRQRREESPRTSQVSHDHLKHLKA